ncbi:hypothetical protein [Herbaspirillum huttiense]|uniref:hypothetical protein n=1 Tax=Herbaspirillum huttiense TaxID=863372 RepID=UPI0039B04AF2
MDITAFDFVLVKAPIPGLPEGMYRIVWHLESKPEILLLAMPKANDPDKPWKLQSSLSQPYVLAKPTLERAIEESVADVAKSTEFAETSRISARANLSEQEKQKESLLREFDSVNLWTIVVTGGWSAEMSRLSKRYGFGVSTVKRLVTTYLLSGRNFEAASQRRPRPKGLPRVVKKKLGRTRDIVKAGRSTNEGVNSADYEPLVRNFMRARGKKRGTIAEQYDDFYTNFAIEGFSQDEHGRPVPVRIPIEKRIRAPAFRALIKKFDIEGYLTRDESERVTQKRQKLRSGSSRSQCPFPGHTYLIDSTVGDIYLVSAFHRWRVIGRPVIYIVIDALTSYILAIHVTLWGPNFNEARRAIYLAMADKTAYLSYLNLEEFAPYFRKGVRPNFLFYDRGELHSKNGEYLGQEMQFSSSVAAAYAAVWKTLVERSFGVLNKEVIHRAPGAVPKERERGDPDYRLQAMYTLSEFRRLMALAQLRWNIGKDMGQHLNKNMMVDSTQDANPLAMWDWGLANLHGSPSYYLKDQLISTVLAPKEVPITGAGFKLDDMSLGATWMDDHPDVRLASYMNTKARIAFTPENPRMAYCQMPSEATFRELHLINIKDFSTDILLPSLEDEEDMNALRKFANEYKDENNFKLLDEVSAKVHQMEAEAKKATTTSVAAASPTISGRVNHMKKHRHVEDEYERTGKYPETASGATPPEKPAERSPSVAVAPSVAKPVKHVPVPSVASVQKAISDEMEGWGA